MRREFLKRRKKRFRDESDRDEIVRLLKKILKGEHQMAKTLAELKQAIADISTAVDADVEQDKEVVRLARVLIDKIKALPNAADFEEEVTALSGATAKLSSDNAAIQTALDEAGTV